MSRSISNTSIAFGLVNVPVKIHKAVEDHRVGFQQRHAGTCGGAIGYVRTCRACAKEVEYADISKGFETEDGAMVTVTSEELAAARGDSIGGIDVVQFCDSAEIPAMVLGSPYYLEPHIGKGKSANTQSYVLLRTVMSGKVAVVKFVLRDAPHLGVLRVSGKALVLQQICWAEDIRTPEFSVLDKEIEPDPRMLQVAQTLVESMVAPFDHASFTDTYTEQVRQLIADKAAGGVECTDDADAETEPVVADLLAKLQASIAAKDTKAAAQKRHPAGRKRGAA